MFFVLKENENSIVQAESQQTEEGDKSPLETDKRDEDAELQQGSKEVTQTDARLQETCEGLQQTTAGLERVEQEDGCETKETQRY